MQDEYGPPEVLELRDVDEPVIGDEEVLLQVRAAGLDPGVWHLMTGLPYLVRVMGFGLRRPKVRVRGRDVAGRVEKIGKSVTGLQPGDEVFGVCDGSFAEYASARPDQLATKPANVSFAQAAGAPISGMTALQALRDVGNVQPGQTVLIIGAGGGVGSFAVQIAKAFGADVTGVCSTSKLELVGSIGADHVIDYMRDDVADGKTRYDLIVDTAGRRPLSHLRPALAARGTLVIVGGEGGGRWLGGFDRQIVRAPVVSLFGGQKLRPVVAKERSEDLVALGELMEAGTVATVIDRTYPLAQAAEAIRYLRQGHAAGKVVITVD
jgi:NADPH:quinone reductase-like Zn-dependent oxidoreductase